MTRFTQAVKTIKLIALACPAPSCQVIKPPTFGTAR